MCIRDRVKTNNGTIVVPPPIPKSPAINPTKRPINRYIKSQSIKILFAEFNYIIPM